MDTRYSTARHGPWIGTRGSGASEPADQLPIGGRELVTDELLGRDPGHRLRLLGRDGARLQAATIEVQEQGPVGILPADRLHQVAHREASAQLLDELSRQARGQIFSGVSLAAG